MCIRDSTTATHLGTGNERPTPHALTLSAFSARISWVGARRPLASPLACLGRGRTSGNRVVGAVGADLS
eukprot:4383945-Pyramimonas_sp.AAC.1